MVSPFNRRSNATDKVPKRYPFVPHSRHAGMAFFYQWRERDDTILTGVPWK